MAEPIDEYQDAFRVALAAWKALLKVDEDISSEKGNYIAKQWIFAAEEFKRLGGSIEDVILA